MKVTTVSHTSVTTKGKTKTYKGLCQTCSNAAECTFKRDESKPILDCDEFNGYEIAGVMLTSEEIGRHTKPECPVSPRKTIAGRNQGLCVNCENRETCTYPRPEGGIWCCEEYV